MDKAFFTKKVLPHIIAVVIFLAITLIFFHPMVFEGKVLNQNDINQGAGSAKEIVDFRKETGKEALWTNSMFGGMPAYLINLRWSGEEISKTIQKVYSLFLQPSLRETFIAFVSFYILLLAFGVRPPLAIAGALAYGLNTFFMVSIEAGHIWKVRAIAYMPMVLAGIHLIFKQKWILGLMLTAIGMTLELLANHLQITYYLLLIVLIYGLVQLTFFINEGKAIVFFKSLGIAFIAVIIALAANFGRIWTTYEYGKYSTRGASELTTESENTESGLERDYVFLWSSGKMESFTFLVPHLYGGASGGYSAGDSELSDVLRRNNIPQSQVRDYERSLLGYWGDQPGVAGPVYAGVVIAFLFILGIFFADKKYKYWLISAAVLGIVLSWGKNFEGFNYFMYEHFPGYNKFRAVSMTVVITIFSINLLGFIGLKNLLEKKITPGDQKNFFIAGGIVIGLLLLIAIFANPKDLEGDQIPKMFIDAVESDRLSIIRTDVVRSVFYVVAAVALIYFYMKKKLSFLVFSILFSLAIVLDLWLVNTRYFGEENYIKPSRNTFFQPTEADEKILKDESIYRVLNLRSPFDDARTSNFHYSIGGYHGAKMMRYSDLITRHLVPEMQQITSDGKISRQNTNVLSALNTKYFIASTSANGAILNPFANGNAWFVKRLEFVNSPDEEIAKIDEVGLDTVAVIDKSKFDADIKSGPAQGTIELTDYQPNKLTYKSKSEYDELAVFSEIYYPEGWSATIDGIPAEFIRANYILRAIEVPKGEHEIQFTFAPKSYVIGNKVVLVANILLLLVIAAAGYLVFKHEVKPASN